METVFGVYHDTASLIENNHKTPEKKELEDSEAKNTIKNINKTAVQRSLDLPNPIQSIFNSRFSISPAISPHTTPPTSRPSTPLLDVSGNRSTLIPSVNGLLYPVDAREQQETISKNKSDPSRIEQSHPLTTSIISPLARTAYQDPSFFQNVKKATGMVEGEDLYNLAKRPSSPWNLHRTGDNFTSGLEGEDPYNLAKRPSSPWNLHRTGDNFTSGLEKGE
ncbi:1392_t:CDS:2 [Acaulospora morrowiae]|uniref:1392_t:CDS:1 n=1 Tax=Acaulospora morrowiae TaxID=94023 RepID=A0A9N9BDZ3_9GLOM|nr:1392_t:CDS:2 [Acaulospora morrowiae]